MVSYYLANASKNGTRCEAQLSITAELNIKETELLTLIGNALENATKAAAHFVDRDFIRIGAKLMDDMLVLKITNSSTEDKYVKGGGWNFRAYG